jgi:hypothetical protein
MNIIRREKDLHPQEMIDVLFIPLNYDINQQVRGRNKCGS